VGGRCKRLKARDQLMTALRWLSLAATAYVRHGTHVAIADQNEITDLEEEEARQAATP
jgi:hypothetical protein